MGGGGSDELVTKSDKGGRGVLTDGDVTTKKKLCFCFAFKKLKRIMESTFEIEYE